MLDAIIILHAYIVLLALIGTLSPCIHFIPIPIVCLIVFLVIIISFTPDNNFYRWPYPDVSTYYVLASYELMLQKYNWVYDVQTFGLTVQAKVYETGLESSKPTLFINSLYWIVWIKIQKCLKFVIVTSSTAWEVGNYLRRKETILT